MASILNSRDDRQTKGYHKQVRVERSFHTLRQLERNGNVTSEWATDKAGPARRIYRLTAQGERHLEEWSEVLDHVSKSMARFVAAARTLKAGRHTQGAKEL